MGMACRGDLDHPVGAPGREVGTYQRFGRGAGMRGGAALGEGGE